MITMIYTISPEEKEEELKWLRDQKIYPGYEDYYDWINQRPTVKFAVIVVPETALIIKLRHNLDHQGNWTRK